jgi:hypothetical protein
MKRCPQCQVEKPLTEFHRHGQHAGYHSWCKICRRPESRASQVRAAARRLASFPMRHPERQRRPCAICGKSFMPRRRGGNAQIYCGPQCRVKKMNDQRRQRYPERIKEWFRRNPEYSAKHQAAFKRRVFEEGYGGAICVCCGETELTFLTMDHIDRTGRDHRIALKTLKTTFYQWLRREGYPVGFRVLCMNCNFATRYGRPCPHTIQEGAAEHGFAG